MYIDFKITQAGYCESYEAIAIKGGRFKKIHFPALVGILKHPTKGIILFDTGYTDRFASSTANFPGKLYAWMTPCFIKKEETIVERLKDMGITPESVNYIIVSHFHADHVCGLSDFPNATYICSGKAYKHLKSIKGVKAVLQGVLTDLIPRDFDSRVWVYDEDADIEIYSHRPYKKVHDLFGDGSILLVHLPGHHVGQIGAIVATPKQSFFLVSDACWLTASYKKNRMPAAITKLLFSDFEAYRKTLNGLYKFHKLYPNVALLPSHCTEIYKTWEEYVV